MWLSPDSSVSYKIQSNFPIGKFLFFSGETPFLFEKEKGSKMKFSIDLKKSVFENAKFYYEESKKARQKVEGARKALEGTLKKIGVLEKEHEISKGKGGLIRGKTVGFHTYRWYEKFRWFFSNNKFLVIGGRDATTNEILIKKYMEKNDIVFHADVHGAPFFIVKNPDGKEIPEETLNETAQAAASYSKAWASGLGSCDVYYVKPEQVSKTAPSGEYIAKGAFMIYGKKEWLRNVKLGIAVGFKVIDDNVEILAGPEDAIISNSDYYVKIGIGDEKSGEISKKIKELILKNAKREDVEKIKKIDIQEIQRVIPGGKGRIIS